MRKAIVFGRGYIYKKYREVIENNYNIIAFIDNGVSDHIYDFTERKDVYNPNQISSITADTTHCSIILASTFYIEMFNQLKDIVDIQEYEDIVIISEEIFVKNGALCYKMNDCSYEVINDYDELKVLKGKKITNYGKLSLSELDTKPFSMDGGTFGKPIDRFFIEKFLRENSGCIRGHVLEVQDDRYITMFGKGKVTQTTICHVEGVEGTKKINFETGEGVEREKYDCIICTQTLQYIYDVRAALVNLYEMIKPGGCVLVTLPGLKPISEYHESKWGEYWSFTIDSVKRLCDSFLNDDSYEVCSYGNVKNACAFLYGLSSEMLNEAELNYVDARYQFLICLTLKKVYL